MTPLPGNPGALARLGLTAIRTTSQMVHRLRTRQRLKRIDLHLHEQYMRLAIAEAQAALELDEVPVGAVIVHQGRVIAAAYNQREMLHDPTAHAEMIAITQAAGARRHWRLQDCALYVTLEPCPMCAGAIVQARISTLVFGATDPKAGACGSLYSIVTDSRLNHQVDVVRGVLEPECAAILKEFFSRKRRNGMQITQDS